MKGMRIVSTKLMMDEETVNGTATVYSTIADIKVGQGTFAVWVKAVSDSGDPNITIQYEQSYNNDSDNFVIPEGAPDVITITDEDAHVISISPVTLPYLRFKVTSNVGNPADTVVTLYLGSE